MKGHGLGQAWSRLGYVPQLTDDDMIVNNGKSH